MARDDRPNRIPWDGSLLRQTEPADLLDDPEVQRLLKVGIVSENPWLTHTIEKALAGKALQQQVQPFRDTPPSIQLLRNQVIIGTTLTGSRYQLQEDDLTRHLLTVGQSGAGKTTLFYNLMEQINVPFWAFDLKQDYRHLLDASKDLVVLPWTELKFNPLRPPTGVPPRRWAQVLTEIFGHATALLSGSKNHFLKKVIQLYDIYDVFSNNEDLYPSLHELQFLVDRDPINYVRKTSNYRDTVLNRLEAMNLTAGTIFDCSEGYPIEELIEQNVVFEFDGLGNDLQNFLMEILFAYVYEYRVAQNQRGGNLCHVFFLDEGKQIFSVYKERQDAAGIPAIDELTAKMREFGEGLVVADQEATKLTDSIKANTYTKVLLPTGDAKQFKEMTGSMHLTEQQEELAAQLGVGEAIVQTGNSDPIPVKLDQFDLDKTISDEELKYRQQREWDRLEYEPRKTIPAFEEAISNGNGEKDFEPPSTLESEADVSEAARRLLKDVVENPFTSLTDRYGLFSNAYKGNKAKNELLEAGFVVERNIRVMSEKRKLLQLTERGREFLEDMGIEVGREGRGGIVHRFWQHRIKELFEENSWTPKLELFNADVYVNLGDSELVVEVAMENSDREIEHVEGHLETGFEYVWIACRNEEIRDGLREKMAEQELLDERVTFRLFSNFSNDEDLSLK